MSTFKNASLAGFIAGLVIVGTAPCRAADESYWRLWKPTSLGSTPFRAVGADSASSPGVGMRLEDVRVTNGIATVTATGGRFDLSWWPLICSQRLPVERDLLALRSAVGPVVTVDQLDDFTCQIECAGAWLTFQGDSTVIIKPKMDLSVDLLVLFKPEFQAQQKGCVLAMDAEGGFGVYPTDDAAFQGQKRPVFWGYFGMSFSRDVAGRARFERGGKAKGPDGRIAKGPEWQKDFGELSYRLKAGQELWISIFPPEQPLDAGSFGKSVGKLDNPYEDPDFDKSKSTPEQYAAYRSRLIERYDRFVPYPGNEIRRLVNVDAFLHNASLQKDIRSSLNIGGRLYRHDGTICFSQTNLLKTPLPISLKWDAPGWQVDPPEVKLRPEPHAVAQASFRFRSSAAGPAPKLLATYQLHGVGSNVVSLTQTFAMPVNEATDVPRLAALGGLDGLADALKDQKPRVIRSDGDRLVEIRRDVADVPRESRFRAVRSAGDSSAEIRLAVAGDSLAVHARVSDPRCRPDVAQWAGKDFGIAGIDIYVGRLGSTQVRQFHFRALSPTGDKNIIFNEDGRTCGEAAFPCRIVAVQPFGYEVHALIPLKDCLLDATTEQFLVDAALLTRNQLKLLYTGDPVRCAYCNSRYFALATVQGQPPGPSVR